MVHEAPTPVLTRFVGPHDRVVGVLVVLRRVLSRRGVAAADVTAGQAQPQLYRVGTVPQALRTRVGQRLGFRVRQRLGVRALFHDCQVTTAARADAHKIDEGRAPGRAAGGGGAMDVMPLLLLVAGSAAIAAAARRTPIPAPLLLVPGGLLGSHPPGVPTHPPVP